MALLENFSHWSGSWEIKEKNELQFFHEPVFIKEQLQTKNVIFNETNQDFCFEIQSTYNNFDWSRYSSIFLWFQPSFYIHAEKDASFLANVSFSKEQENSWWGFATNAMPKIWNRWVIPISRPVGKTLYLTLKGKIPKNQKVIWADAFLEDTSVIQKNRSNVIHILEPLFFEYQRLFRNQLKESILLSKNCFSLICMKIKQPSLVEKNLFEIPCFAEKQGKYECLYRCFYTETTSEIIWKICFHSETQEKRQFFLETMFKICTKTHNVFYEDIRLELIYLENTLIDSGQDIVFYATNLSKTRSLSTI